MKQTIRTLLKDVDDLPVLYFENLDNDKQAEVFYNEYWKWTEEANNMDLQDIIDKKQVFLYGRSFDQWQIVDGKVKMTVQDPMDILVDRYLDPSDLHSSRFLIHVNIFKPLSVVRQNPDYDQEAIQRMTEWYATQAGIVKITANSKTLTDKNEKMRLMGVDDIDSPILGETYMELSMHFVFEKNDDDEEEQIYLYVEADNQEILMKKPLEEVIGKTKDNWWRTHYPYESWADDLERQDFWSDGLGDIVRQSNKVLNTWFSQLVENRTLRNFGMHYYDSSIEGFTPGSFNPVPWGWYGVPGKPSDVLQKVDIPDLSESLDEMSFVITMMEKATGATTTQQGEITDRQITLGEVKLALGEAKERIKGMSKFYTPAWKRRGQMFVKMIEAGADKLDAVKIYKKGKNTNDIFSREIAPENYMTKSGYQVKVWSQEEKNTQDTDTLQKLNVAKTVMPFNPKLNEIYKRKLLEFADLTPEQTNEVMEQEREAVQSTPVGGTGGSVGQVAPPVPSNGVTPNLNQQPVQQQ